MDSLLGYRSESFTVVNGDRMWKNMCMPVFFREATTLVVNRGREMVQFRKV